MLTKNCLPLSQSQSRNVFMYIISNLWTAYLVPLAKPWSTTPKCTNNNWYRLCFHFPHSADFNLQVLVLRKFLVYLNRCISVRWNCQTRAKHIPLFHLSLFDYACLSYFQPWMCVIWCLALIRKPTAVFLSQESVSVRVHRSAKHITIQCVELMVGRTAMNV